jgi:hypothetical protein
LGELARKIVAGFDLGGQRLVVGRQAFDRIGDARAEQAQPVVGRVDTGALARPNLCRSGTAGCRHVARERAAGAIRAMLAGRKSDDQEARLGSPNGGTGRQK